MKSGGSDHRIFVYATTLAVAFFFLNLTWYVFSIGGHVATQWWSDLNDVPITLLSSFACIVAARRQQGRARRAWFFLAAGMTSWGLGEVVWAFYELILHREVPFPSLADAGYLLLIPFVAVGLLSFPTAPRAASGRGRVLLDGLTIAISLFGLSWATALGAAYSGAGKKVFENVLGIAYPFGDIVLIGLVLFVASRTFRARRSTVVLIAAGIFSISISDSLFTFLTYHGNFGSDMASNLVGLGWTAGWLLIGLGAIRSKKAIVAEDVATSKFSAFLPYIGVFAATPVLTIRLFLDDRHDDPILLATLVALFVVVTVRQLLVVLENRRLAATLECKVSERTYELEDALGKIQGAMDSQERMHAAQREFVRIAAHELETPTVPIATFATMLLEKWDSTPDAQRRKQLEVIERQARRLRRLTTMLIGISRIDSGTIEVSPAEIDIKKEILVLIAELGRGQPIELFCDDDARAYADPDYFRSMVASLIENAVVHGAAPVMVDVHDDGPWMQISVADSGVGVPDEFVPRLFEKFAQAQFGSNLSSNGTGVGLFSVRELARAHGGDAWYTSKADGHAFVFRLPSLASENSETVRFPLAG